MTLDGPFDRVCALPELTERELRTPAAGKRARPFRVVETTFDGVLIETSRGGQVTLRQEAFDAALKLLRDLGAGEEDGWVRVSDETLVMVLQAENRDHACGSYVLPLLEATGLIELDRGRPARARLAPQSNA